MDTPNWLLLHRRLLYPAACRGRLHAGHRQEELEPPVGGGVRVRVARHHSAHIHAAGDAGENVCCRAGIERRNEELIKSVVFQK